MEKLSYYSIQPNSISCFIGRICETPGDSFETDGVLWVDFNDLDGSKNGPKHGEAGSTQHKAIASWTLRSAFIAWNKPPKITYHGTLTLKGTAKGKSGNIKLSNAQLSQIALSGGPPLTGTITSPAGPGTSSTPLVISGASGTGTIEATGTAEFEFSQDNTIEADFHTGDDGTEDDKLDISLTSQRSAQLPWCTASIKAEESAETPDDGKFIKAGDKALCLAFGNSMRNLFVVDIFR